MSNIFIQPVSFKTERKCSCGAKNDANNHVYITGFYHNGKWRRGGWVNKFCQRCFTKEMYEHFRQGYDFYPKWGYYLPWWISIELYECAKELNSFDVADGIRLIARELLEGVNTWTDIGLWGILCDAIEDFSDRCTDPLSVSNIRDTISRIVPKIYNLNH
jgi:hypothetical protein